MKKSLNVVNGQVINVDQIPIECPYCHKSQIPAMQVAYLYKSNNYFIFCVCTNSECGFPFNISYNSVDQKFLVIKQLSFKKKEFNIEIQELSQPLCEIYNQAYFSEQMGLDQITGVGYRKALEFLIKDYLISLNPDKEEKIKKKSLGNCIKDDVTDSHIKAVAERAVWLGNDETHYVRKWEDKDLSNLKDLIDLCIHWIEAEIKTKRMLDEMPG